MSGASKAHTGEHDLFSRRTIVAAALGTSAFAYAAVRSGALGGGGSDDADGSSDTVRVVNGSRSDAGTASVSATAAPVASDFATLSTRHRNMLTGGNGFTSADSPYAGLNDGLDAKVASYLSSLNTSSGRTYLWNDQASGVGSANMTASFSRLRVMAIQYATAGSDYAGDTTLLRTINAALEWLATNRYYKGAGRANNWWDWDIGSPLAMLDTALVLGSNMSATARPTLMTAAEDYYSTSGNRTAANLAWLTRGALLHAIAVSDATEFSDAVTTIKGMYASKASGDGFRADGSFIQHTIHPYTGGYGVEMFFQLSWLTYLLGGPNSTFVVPGDWAIMKDWIYGSFEPLLFRGAIPGAVLGRNIARNYSTDHAAGATFLGSVALLSAVAASADTPTLRSLFKTQVIADKARDFFTYDPVTGIGNLTMYIASLGQSIRNDGAVGSRDEANATTIFPGMDRFVHRKPGWAFTVAAFSSRTANYESINGENRRGWYTAAGMTYFYTQYDLDHFQDDFWPTVDPYRLPGTTIDTRHREDGVTESSTAQSPMVGGVSDGNCGVGLMTINRDGGSMKAQKSWIFIGDYIVCQGSGITNTSAYPVETIVENRNIGASGTNGVQFNAASNTVLAGVSTDGQPLSSANWVHVDGVGGYLFPANTSNLFGFRDRQQGAWSDLNKLSERPSTPTDMRTRDYITLYLKHGVGPTNAAYNYIFMPSASTADTAAAFSNGQVTRQATTTAHYAVGRFSSLDVYGAAFWQSGSIGIFAADAPVAIVVRATNGNISVTLSDPTQAQTGTISVTLNLANSGVRSQNAGTSVSRTATSAIISFTPSALSVKGGNARVVLAQ